MPLVLPFIKLFVNDWLTSEKIALMDAPQIGSYIMLLTQCWTQESCTLPSAPAVLKKLGKWSDEQYGDFGPVLACFTPYKKTGRVTNPRLYKEWMQAQARTELLSESGQRGAAKRWAKRSVVRTKRTRAIHILTEAEFDQFWTAYPRKDDKRDARMALEKALQKTTLDTILQAISRAIPTEGWTKDHGQYIPLPTTWLNKERWADQPLSNGSTTLICPHHPTLTFPDAQAKRTHDFSYHPKYVG